MSRYDGLIIPRSYSDYINKTDAATLLQALQLSGVMDATPTQNSNHPAQSGGVFNALGTWEAVTQTETFTVKGLEAKNGRYLFIRFEGYQVSSSGETVFTLPVKWRPARYGRVSPYVIDENLRVTTIGFANINDTGTIKLYGGTGLFYGDFLLYIDN